MSPAQRRVCVKQPAFGCEASALCSEPRCLSKLFTLQGTQQVAAQHKLRLALAAAQPIYIDIPSALPGVPAATVIRDILSVIGNGGWHTPRIEQYRASSCVHGHTCSASLSLAWPMQHGPDQIQTSPISTRCPRRGSSAQLAHTGPHEEPH